MRRVNDQVILMIYSLALACTIKVDTLLVIALLIAVIYLALMTLTETSDYWRYLIVTSLFLAFSFFCPLCLLFSPLVIYHLISRQNKLFLVISLLLKKRAK